MVNTYVEFLRQQGTPLYEHAGTVWAKHRGVVMPAALTPIYVEMGPVSANQLLRTTGAPMLRWSSQPTEMETPWWWVVCDRYDWEALSRNARNQIRRGLKACAVRRVSGEWLARHGYECYRKAHKRYVGLAARSREQFQGGLLRIHAYPNMFQYWGVFCGEQLAGYVQCVVSDGAVATNVLKLNPDYFEQYASYALLDAVLGHYVRDLGLPVSNGTRSISHETNIQQFLVKFGFRRQFCQLNVAYSLPLDIAVRVAYPARHLLRKLPQVRVTDMARSLLFQEELRRACQLK